MRFRSRLTAWFAASIALMAAAPVDDVVNLQADRSQRMTVPVSIGGKGPYQFVVDTGSERTVLSEELAGALGLDASGSVLIHSVSGVSTVDTVAVKMLSVSKTPAHNVTAPLFTRHNLGADGMLGIDSLQTQRILLDFRARTMTVSPSQRRPDPALDDDDTIVVQARNRLGRLILVDASINDRKIAVIIDTGAEHSIGNPLLKKRVVGRGRNIFVIPTTIHSVTGGSVPAEIAIVKSMRIGSLTLTDMPIAFADLEIFRQLGLDRKPAMLLGMNTLRAFDLVSVDFANRKVSFVIPGDSRRSDGIETALLTD